MLPPVPPALALSPVTEALFGVGMITIDDYVFTPPLWALLLTVPLGIALLCLTLHMARGLGQLQGQLAKHLLVKTAQY